MSLQSKFDDVWAWLALAAIFLAHCVLSSAFHCSSMINTFLLEAFGESRTYTALPISIMAGMLNFFGIVASVAENRYGPRVIMFAGFLLSALGVFLTAFVHSIPLVIFSLGILCGTGLSLTYLGCVTAVPLYFIHYRTLAFGIFAAGGNASSFIFPPLLGALVPAYSWRGTLIILSGFLLQGLILCMVLKPKERKCLIAKLASSEANEKKNSDVPQKERIGPLFQDKVKGSSCERLSTVENDTIRAKGLEKFDESVSINNFFSLLNESTSNKQANDEYHAENKIKRSACLQNLLKYYHVDIFQNKTFLCILICGVFRALGKFTFLIFITPFLLEKGYSFTEAGQAYMMIGITQVIMVPIFGVIANILRYYNGLFWAVSLIFCSLLIFACTFVDWHKVALFAVLTVYGAAEGVFDALWGAVIADALDVKRLGNGSGTASLLYGASGILSPLLAGKLADITGTFSTSFYLSGTGYAIAAAVAFLCFILQHRQGFIYEIDVEDVAPSSTSQEMHHLTENPNT